MRNSRFLVLLVALAPAALAVAQGISGSIQGTVMDSSGAAIPDARVVARNLDTGITLETRSNQVGLYFVGELRPGRYQLEADAPGFSDFRQSGIVLRIEDRLRVDIRLELRTVSASIEVMAEAPVVQSENNTIGKVVEERHIKQLPLSGRNAFALTLLVPGVQQRRDDEHPRLSGGRSRNGDRRLVQALDAECGNFVEGCTTMLESMVRRSCIRAECLPASPAPVSTALP